MATPMIIPHLGESVESAVLVAWHKQVGDAVKRGEEIADVETDKAVMPLEAPQNGVLLAQMVAAGSSVRIGQLIAMIGRAGETPAVPESPATPVQPAPTLSTAPAPTAEAPRRKISPLARRMAREYGIDLNSVPASASDKVSSREIQQYLKSRGAAASPAVPPALPMAPAAGLAGLPQRRVALSNIRRITGQRMAEGAQAIPQFSVTTLADAAALVALQAELAAAGSPATITALLVALTAAALMAHPQANARYAEGDLIVYETVNMGVAVAAEDGLRVPVVARVETLRLSEVQSQLAALAERARAGRLSPGDVNGATFSLSNLGMFGVAHFTPLVNPPQAAILGVGAIQPVFVPDAAGQPRLIQQMALTLTADHRALDGAEAAAFLKSLKELIEDCKNHFLRRL